MPRRGYDPGATAQRTAVAGAGANAGPRCATWSYGESGLWALGALCVSALAGDWAL